MIKFRKQSGVDKFILAVTIGASTLLTPLVNAEETEAPTVYQYNKPVVNVKPSFEGGTNAELLAEAHEVKTGATELVNEVKSMDVEMSKALEDLKVAILEKKEQERKQAQLELLRSTSVNKNIVISEGLVDFLSEAKKHRFENYDARIPSNLTADELDSFVADTGLAGLGETYAQAEKQYGISAFVLLALSAHESGWGNSRLSRDKNNIFGYMAYDRDPYNSAMHFATKGEGVLLVAEKITKNYLSAEGVYFNGYTLQGMNVKYSSDLEWWSKITSIMNRLVEKQQA